MATIDDNLAKAITEVLRQAQIDISNQDKLLVGPGDVTLTRADGTTATGPSWPKMSGLVNSVLQWRGALPANANLNSYGPTSAYTGQWSQNSATGAQIANGFPEDNAVGVLDVIPGGAFGCTQKYTVSRTGNIYLRTLTGSWNGTDGPWGAWLPVGFSSMPGYFTGDMNVLVTPGIWSITSAVTNGPIPDGQTATPTGICTVELRSSTNSVVQTFKSVVTNAAFINRTWTRTLSGTTWSNWDPQGKGALNDLGLGLTVKAGLASLDWNQFDFASGQEFSVAAGNMTNTPSGIDTTGWGTTQVCFNVIGIDGGITTVECWLSHTNNSLFRRYQVRVAGNKGSRTFTVRQIWTSADVLPLGNGGTGGTTQAAARTGLGLKSAAIHDVYDNNMVFQGDRKVAMQAISDYRGITAYAGILNFPQGLSGGVTLGGHLPQSGLGASDLVGQLVCVPWVDPSGNTGAFKISARGNKVWFTGTDTNDFFSRAYAFRTEANTAVDGNGFIKTASPIVNVFGDGSVVTNEESDGCTVTRIDVGQYLIEGCLGLNSDAAWGGIDGGFEIPLDRNKQPKVWLDYEVNPDGSVMVKTYHREHAGAPRFARNIIEGVADGDPVDIPAGQFISVRVEMPMDSIWNQQQEKARIRNEEALAQAVLEAKLKAEAEAEAERLKAEEEEPDDPAEQPDVQQ